jgi:Glycosyltransferase family 87
VRRLVLAVGLFLVAAGSAHAAAIPTSPVYDAHGRIIQTPLAPPEQPALLTKERATAIFLAYPKVKDWLSRYPRDRTTDAQFNQDLHYWQVNVWWGKAGEIATGRVDDATKHVTEAWTGPQVAWKMARGYNGAFGGSKINSYSVWLSFCAVFLLGLVDWRRPLSLRNLDLLAMLSFSVSLWFFNHGNIFASAPLAYPPLVYLIGRGLWIGFTGRAPRGRTVWPVWLLLAATAFGAGFRVTEYNVRNSNVIDVGYSGVIGADRITDGMDLYGSFPQGNLSGDTYGPVNYLAYVPFELVFPWSGRWDSLPAAHAAAIFFDLATIVALIFVGRRLIPGEGGNRLGLTLGYAWAAYPYTLFVSNSNANDSLVALLVVLAFLALRSSPGRGALLGLATAAKFAPVALAPLFAGFDRRRPRGALVFAATFIAVVALLAVAFLPDGGPRELWDRTIGFQLGRDSPFSIWGQEDWLAPLQVAVKIAAAALALVVGLYPRRKSPLQVAALGAAVLIALQLGLSHWFYLYIVWWFPLVLIALLARGPGSARSSLPLHSRPT